ncbi:MAG: hypothetical protein ACOYBE_02335 [Blautia sp.]
MTWFQFMKGSNLWKYVVVVLGACFILGALLLLPGEKHPSVDEQREVFFDSEKVVPSKYQKVNSSLKVELTVSPKEIDLKKQNTLIVHLKNKSGKQQIWGRRGDTIFFERLMDGKWCYSSGNFPGIDNTEMERVLDRDVSTTYEYKLIDPMEPGQYRFTALFKSGLVAADFIVK